MSQRSYNAESLFIENDCIKLGDYTLFENRLSPYFVTFDPLIGKASLHKKLAKQLCEKLRDCGILTDGKNPFLLGNPVYGVPIAAALTQEIYEQTGQEAEGRGLRFGYFAKEEDLLLLDRNPEKTKEAFNKEHGNVKIVNMLKIESTGLRGDDLAFVARGEAKHILKYNSDITGIVASGYSGMPFATAIANEMLKLGKDLYVAYERLSTKAYDPTQSLFVGKTDPNGGKAIIVSSSERPDSSGFYGLLQEGDEVVTVDDIAGREKPIIDNINKVAMRNPRAKIRAVLVGVNREEKDGTKELAESLNVEHIDLCSLTTSLELLKYWTSWPDDSKRLSPEKYGMLMKYQTENMY
ncbi:MAG: hypothetical protein V1836_04350 [Candidatus Aenigmatarchaeota archaeon]